MSFFGKFFRPALPVEVPEWCGPLDADGYRRFRRLAREALAQWGPFSDADIDSGLVRACDLEIGFSNLTASLSAMPRSRWRGAITEYISGLMASPDQYSDEQLRKILKLRLTPPIYTGRVGGPPENDVPFTTGPMIDENLQAAFAFDYPTKVSYDAKALERLGRQETSEDLYRIALANVEAAPIPRAESTDFFGAKLRIFESTDHFAASKLLVLESILPAEPWGALAIVPTADFLGVVPLAQMVRAPALNALPHLRAFAEKTHKGGAYPCSPYVYWWSPAGLERVHIELSGNDANVTPSPALLQAMEALVAGS